MTAPDLTAQSIDLARYSVTPTDVQTVQKQLNDARCDDRMVRQYIQATGGDLKAVSSVITLPRWRTAAILLHIERAVACCRHLTPKISALFQAIHVTIADDMTRFPVIGH